MSLEGCIPSQSLLNEWTVFLLDMHSYMYICMYVCILYIEHIFGLIAGLDFNLGVNKKLKEHY